MRDLLRSRPRSARLRCRHLLSLLLATLPSWGQAAPEWRWSHPFPHGNNIADLTVRAGLYLEVTDHGGIYTSTDRLNWTRQASGTLRNLRAVTVLGSRWIVTGEEGTVLWSDDATTFQAGSVTPATTDWFEGVAATTGRAVAVGDNAAIYTSTDGQSWARVSGLGFTDWLSGVAYGAGLFVAVGDAGLIVTSPNGTTWTRRTSATTSDLTRVAYGDGRFLVVGRQGVVLTSVNGTSWSADAATGTTNSLFAATLAPGERLVVGDSAFLLRKPPVTWQDQTSAVVSPSPVPAWVYAATLWDGERFVAAGRTGVFVESFRTNSGPLAGQTFWFRNDDSPRNLLSEVTRIGDTYLAVGDQGTILSSANGVAWTAEGAPITADVILYGVGGSPKQVLAVGTGGTLLQSSVTETNRITTNLVVAGGRTNVLFTTNRISLAGVVWDSVASPTTNTLQGVAWNGSRYVVTGAGGTVLTSTNGIAWSRSTIAGAGFLSSVAVFPGGWVVSGAAGALYTSSNAVAWTKRTSGTTNWIYRVRAVGDGWVGVGQNGTLLTSDDGTSWVSRSSGTDAWLTDAIQVGRYTYVCGTGGTMLRSTNRVAWTALGLPTGKALYGLAVSGAQLVTVGDEGIVLRTLGDDAAAAVDIARYGWFPGDPEPVEGFVFQGSPEQAFRLEGGGEFGTWETEADLRLDAAGNAVQGRVAAEARRFHRTVTRP